MVGTVAVGVTRSFFSDTETSTGNTFTAGAIDLKIDSEATYNGQPWATSTWALKDLVPTSDKFFNFADIKPGDSGENTISLHVINNDAWVCAAVSNLTDFENGQTEPEASVDSTTGTNQGELSQTMVWKVWRDNGEGGGVAGDNIQNGEEETLASGHPTNGVLALYDSTTGTPLAGGSTTYLGVSWSLPAVSGNETQTDSLTGDISFRVEQSRNNANFRCDGQQEPQVESLHISLENKAAGSWQIIADDNTYGDIQYSSNDTTFHGTVTGTGLVAGGKYQITLNGPGACTFTDNGFAGKGPNAFSSGYWNNGTGLESTCSTPGEGVYNMDLIGDHYTFIADGSGAFTHNFSFSLPVGNYSGVKVLVKKMLNTHVSPWADTGAGYPTFNLYETAPISFTVL